MLFLWYREVYLITAEYIVIIFQTILYKNKFSKHIMEHIKSDNSHYFEDIGQGRTLKDEKYLTMHDQGGGVLNQRTLKTNHSTDSRN